MVDFEVSRQPCTGRKAWTITEVNKRPRHDTLDGTQYAVSLQVCVN